MIIDERQNKILNLLSEKKFISYKELSKLLYSSTSTIRRDVSKMHSQGLLVMVKGGVTGVNTNATESSRSLRELEGTIEKRKIILIKVMVLGKTGQMMSRDPKEFFHGKTIFASTCPCSPAGAGPGWDASQHAKAEEGSARSEEALHRPVQ